MAGTDDLSSRLTVPVSFLGLMIYRTGDGDGGLRLVWFTRRATLGTINLATLGILGILALAGSQAEVLLLGK